MNPQVGTSLALAATASASPAERTEVDPRTFGVLSSRARVALLRAVTVREMSIAELVQELRLHRTTVRYHLAHLLREGLVEEVRSAPSGRAGRPATLYRAARHTGIATFPQRRFELLGQLAIETLVEEVGKERASRRLKRKGANVSVSMLRQLASKSGVDRWTPEVFEQLVLKGLFKEMGLVTEIQNRTPNVLVYRAFSCPFLELAEKMPEEVCDSLDQGFHEGMDRALGRVRTTRLACMGHGNPYCEYQLEWKSERGPRPKERNPVRDGNRGDGET